MSWHVVVMRGEARFLAFTYVDRTAGPSAKGVKLAGEAPTDAEAMAAASRPDVTIRLGSYVELTPLAPAELDRLGLPAEPEWMSFFKGGAGPWNADPRLAGQFHASFPDDVQARFHFPATKQVELMWVRLDRAVPEFDAYEGQLLNTAHADPAIAAGMRVRVRAAPGVKPPVWLSPEIERNREEWKAQCKACGFDLVLEPMAAVIARQFADAPQGSTMEAFTTRCAECSGTQMVQRRQPFSPRGQPILTPQPDQLMATQPPRPRLLPGLIAAVAAGLAALAWWLLR